MKILITGVAGFIGMHLAYHFLQYKNDVTGIDNLNDYYDVNLKKARLEKLKKFKNLFNFFKMDISNYKNLSKIFEDNQFDIVINLAAQAGVRYSLLNPTLYLKSNIEGFFNVLECCRVNQISHLIFASSSSVYGFNDNYKFSETNETSKPLSFYGATKKSNEVMAYSYSNIYNMKITGLRFFTVYGPWGRPDMALFLFTKSILSGVPIDVYNNGKVIRDFTYIDDVVDAIFKISTKESHNHIKNSKNKENYNLFNIGNGKPIELINYINLLEEVLKKKAVKNFLPLPVTDSVRTSSDNKSIEDFVNFKPKTSIKMGVTNFVNWYKDYFNI